MIYLDTHVLVWLYSGLIDKFSEHAKDLIDKNDLYITPIIQLELTYLHEVKKVNKHAHTIIHDLQSRIGLKICDLSYIEIVDKAATLSWTRDPFDRLIVAQVICASAKLLTKDETILKNSKHAVWN